MLKRNIHLLLFVQVLCLILIISPVQVVSSNNQPPVSSEFVERHVNQIVNQDQSIEVGTVYTGSIEPRSAIRYTTLLDLNTYYWMNFSSGVGHTEFNLAVSDSNRYYETTIINETEMTIYIGNYSSELIIEIKFLALFTQTAAYSFVVNPTSYTVNPFELPIEGQIIDLTESSHSRELVNAQAQWYKVDVSSLDYHGIMVNYTPESPFRSNFRITVYRQDIVIVDHILSRIELSYNNGTWYYDFPLGAMENGGDIFYIRAINFDSLPTSYKISHNDGSPFLIKYNSYSDWPEFPSEFYQDHSYSIYSTDPALDIGMQPGNLIFSPKIFDQRYEYDYTSYGLNKAFLTGTINWDRLYDISFDDTSVYLETILNTLTNRFPYFFLMQSMTLVDGSVFQVDDIRFRENIKPMEFGDGFQVTRTETGVMLKEVGIDEYYEMHFNEYLLLENLIVVSKDFNIQLVLEGTDDDFAIPLYRFSDNLAFSSIVEYEILEYSNLGRDRELLEELESLGNFKVSAQSDLSLFDFLGNQMSSVDISDNLGSIFSVLTTNPVNEFSTQFLLEKVINPTFVLYKEQGIENLYEEILETPSQTVFFGIGFNQTYDLSIEDGVYTEQITRSNGEYLSYKEIDKDTGITTFINITSSEVNLTINIVSDLDFTFVPAPVDIENTSTGRSSEPGVSIPIEPYPFLLGLVLSMVIYRIRISKR